MTRPGRPESRIDPDELDPVRAFRSRPLGPHGPALEAMLDILRSGSMAGKFCLVCIEPHERWALATLSGIRGEVPTIRPNRVFRSIEEAEWEVFKLRWEAETGMPIPEDRL